MVRGDSPAARRADCRRAAAAQLGSPSAGRGAVQRRPPSRAPSAAHSRTVAGIAVLRGGACCCATTRNMEAEQFEVLGLLVTSVMPLGILTVVVLGVILFGITTATESAGGRRGRRLPARLPCPHAELEENQGGGVPHPQDHAMVCWLFVGSALFSAVFAILGGQALLESWVLSLNLSPVQFMILSQAIIFVLGWPLEWTEIIVIFVPIFLPMLKHFSVDPILWGVLVFVNLQAAFLSPPVAMSAFYLKGVAPKHVTLNQIFAGMMPYMLIVIICMVIMYIWPGMTLWLPRYLYGG